MIRTQIYLTDQQRSELALLSKSKGKKQSELIREAIDQLIEKTSRKRRNIVLNEAAGIWKNRSDLPDLESTRSGWDRG